MLAFSYKSLCYTITTKQESPRPGTPRQAKGNFATGVRPRGEFSGGPKIKVSPVRADEKNSHN
jgi:hypothetical protein